jgi:beta-lactamase superfamily II metal-dependent hydrolase
LLCDYLLDRKGLPVLSNFDFAQYVIRHVSHTYTSVLSKSFSYKKTETSSTERFVAAARAAFAVIPVGVDSPFGHPDPQVVARWRAAGAEVLQTGRRGTINFTTDGERLTFETFVRE